MKRTLIIAGLIILTGCASTIPMEERIITTGYDFSEYTEKGFLITPEQYLGEYQSIGLITVNLTPSVSEKESVRTSTGQYINHGWNIGALNVTKAIDELYQQAKDMGADAITRFHINHTERINGEITVPGAEISGFAIKRK